MKRYLKILFILFFLFIYILLFSLKYVSKKTNRFFLYFPKIIVSTLKENNIPSKLNLVILGLDPRDDWLEKTQTTDTIIYTQVDFSKNKISLFSFPRDLWNYFTSAKINQIYPTSAQKPNQPEKFDYIQQNFASISGQPINRTLVLTTENLKQLADILGGIDLFLENGFIDEKYPNDAYILNPKSTIPIYKTVEFKSGWIHLDSSNITEFVRSRKSSDTADSGGTDLGRIQRQQQLINTLLDKLRNTLSQKPQLIFNLYNYWGSLEHNFSDTEIIGYLLKYGLNLRNISITRYPISSGEDPKENLLYHPSKFINSQWVFIPQDKDYQALHQYLSVSLDSP